MRNVIILRTHKFDARVQQLYARYATVRDALVVLGMDERRDVVEVGGARKVGITDGTLERLGLYPHPKSGWQCGDYVYYAVREAFPGHDFYWMVEPDLEINFGDPNDFFRGFDAVGDDLLAAMFGPRSRTAGKPGTAEGAGWATLMAGQHGTAYGCLFPITRLSGRAIDYLGRRRAEAHPGEAQDARDSWPNDEAFVCTEAVSGGFVCSDLNSHGRQVYDPKAGFTSWRRRQDLYLLGRSAGFVEGLLYHPVLTVPEYVEALVKDYRAHTGEFVHFAGRLGDAFDAGRLLATLEDEIGGAANRASRNRLNKETWTEDGFLLALRGAGAPGERLPIQRLLRRTTPASGVGAVTHQSILSNNRTGEFAPASQDDFGLGPPIDIDYFPRHRMTAYCIAPARRELLFVGTYNGRALLDEPFLYGAQAAQARHLVRVPFDRVAEMFPAPGAEAAQPTIIFSIGRCGSTLLSFLCGAHGAVSASEPDVFSQIAVLARVARAGRAAPKKAADLRIAPSLLHATVRSVQDYAGQEDVVVKLRTAANKGAALIASAFPHANYVFVFREMHSWARSHVEAFNRDSAHLSALLGEGIAAYDTLRQAGVRCSVVWYEEMSRDPEGTLRTIFGPERTITDDTRAALNRIMARDSQQGTSIARGGRPERGDNPEAEAVVEQFEDLWQRDRPAALIKELGLPY
ncbi:MAG: sulfotransferase [Acetobacteraceae bacterium]|nr:sulfotransferase [Acetobacteraceae bacterium]